MGCSLDVIVDPKLYSFEMFVVRLKTAVDDGGVGGLNLGGLGSGETAVASRLLQCLLNVIPWVMRNQASCGHITEV